ncbi:thioredoxin domain-containing protein [bacterium]|nr:thioredoxin domain-containing protein [bacterium]
MTNFRRILLIILALIGIALSVELTNVYINANFIENAQPSICAISETINCDGVARTLHSQFFGVPLALWGLLLYLFIFIVSFADKLKDTKLFRFMEVFKNPQSYIFSISLLAFIISMGLAAVSFFEIHMICIFCFVTYFLDFVIALCAKDYTKPLHHEIAESVKDFADALKIKKYAVTFGILVILFAGALWYFDTSSIMAPQVARDREIQSFLKDSFNSVDGNILGDEDAKIVIDEYIDYNCGGCYLMNLNSHRAVVELKGIRVNQHNLPLDQECNKYMPHPGHKNSCLKAKYALAARKQNKFWHMNDLLMFKSPESEDDILGLAQSMDIDVQKLKADAHSEEVAKELEAEIETTERLQINATPTLIIGIKRHTGSMSYPEYKDMLLQMGAQER